MNWSLKPGSNSLFLHVRHPQQLSVPFGLEVRDPKSICSSFSLLFSILQRQNDIDVPSVSDTFGYEALQGGDTSAAVEDVTPGRVANGCPGGASNGRGPRCAAWFLEYVRAAGDDNMQCFTLEGGIKGWVKAGPQYTRLLDGYQEEHWNELFKQEDQKKAEESANTAAPQKTLAGTGEGDVGQ